MGNRILYIVIGLFTFFNCKLAGQNLVTNPSFEKYNNCPTHYSDIDSLPYGNFRFLTDWVDPTGGSSDYYNTCSSILNPASVVGVPLNSFGYQWPHSGNGYAGFYNELWIYDTLAMDPLSFEYREYIETRLSKPLQAGHQYRISYNISSNDKSRGDTELLDAIGVLLTDTVLYNYYYNVRNSFVPILFGVPAVANMPGDYITDTSHWVHIQGDYIAQGGELWMTLGHFNAAHNDVEYIYIDDVCLMDLTDAPTSKKDTLIYTTTQTLHGDSMGKKFLWNTGDTTESITVTASGTYWVHSEAECFYQTDTFRVTFCQSMLRVPSDKNICQGDSVILSASGADNYSWSPVTGLSCSNCAAPYAAPVGSIIYTLIGSNLDGCRDTAQLMITVDTAIAAFTITRDSLCQDDTLHISNTSQGSNLSYQWYFGNGDTATAYAPTYVYTLPGTYTISLVTTNVNCRDSISQSVRIDTAGSYFTFSIDTDHICIGEAVQFVSTHGNGTAAITWYFGDNSDSVISWHPVHAYDYSGTMIVTATGYYHACPPLDFKDTIIVYPYPIVNIGPDTALCLGQTAITLTNLQTAQDQIHYLNRWSNGDTSTTIEVSTPGIYWLQITSGQNCTASDTIEIKPNCYVAIPNAFSPNGDGVNDYFFPRQLLTRGIRTFHMQIYNRWGEQIFETNSIDGRGWDGRINGLSQPEGVYIYTIEVGFVNGGIEKYQDNVTLIR